MDDCANYTLLIFHIITYYDFLRYGSSLKKLILVILCLFAVYLQ